MLLRCSGLHLVLILQILVLLEHHSASCRVFICIGIVESHAHRCTKSGDGATLVKEKLHRRGRVTVCVPGQGAGGESCVRNYR